MHKYNVQQMHMNNFHILIYIYTSAVQHFTLTSVPTNWKVMHIQIQ